MDDLDSFDRKIIVEKIKKLEQENQALRRMVIYNFKMFGRIKDDLINYNPDNINQVHEVGNCMRTLLSNINYCNWQYNINEGNFDQIFLSI